MRPPRPPSLRVESDVDWFELSGEVGSDMDAIRDFYADKTGRHPELFGEIRLPEEGPAVS